MPKANIPSNFSEVYDLDHQHVSVIPTAELAPGMTPIPVRCLGRVCWVNTEQAARHGLLPSPEHSAEVVNITDMAALPVERLQDKAVRETLRGASVVLGIDGFTGNSSLFYGAESLKEIIRSNTASPLPVVTFLYDSRTDSLEYLYAAVKHLKGSCCYGGA